MSYALLLTQGPAPTVLERPVLRMGLLGFGAEQHKQISHALMARGPGADAPLSWELASIADADAWFINGARTQWLEDGTLRVGPGETGARSVRFQLGEIHRPLAFCEPLAARLDGVLKFDLDAADTLQRVLGHFEYALRPLSAQLCLASQLLQRENELHSRIYHLEARGRLLAVVDLRGDCAVRPTAGLRELAGAAWSARPASAAYFPEDFARASMSQLMWQYAVRSREDLLPHRYRLGPIYYRRAPRLLHRLLKDSHLLLLRELATGPSSFTELQRSCGLTASDLGHSLAALYLVGAITSSARRARSVSGSRLPLKTNPTQSVVPSGLTLDSEPPAMPMGRADPTVPAPLGQHA